MAPEVGLVSLLPISECDFKGIFEQIKVIVNLLPLLGASLEHFSACKKTSRIYNSIIPFSTEMHLLANVVENLAGITAILAALKFVSWTKMTLGAFLAALGAFFPHGKHDKVEGEGNLNFKGVKMVMKGSLRIGVILCGAILLMGTVLEGYRKSEAQEDPSKPASVNVRNSSKENPTVPATSNTPTDIKPTLTNQLASSTNTSEHSLNSKQ